MAGAVKHAKLESRTSRSRLKRGRQPHWQALQAGAIHLGYQRRPDEAAGRWILRRRIGDKYAVMELGRADDDATADGAEVLDHAQAVEKARALLASPSKGKRHRLSVRQALDDYVAFKRAQGQPVKDVLSRATAHILPVLGDCVVADLESAQLRRWLAALADAPAQVRPKAGKPQYQPAPTEERVRARQASANRVLTMLKAALNHAYDEGHVSNRDAWGRKLKPFRDVEVARVRYLSVAEASRLINACDEELRPLVTAALLTGCRYGELARLEVCDFNPDAGTVAIRKSKSGKPRHVVLTEEGVAFFTRHCAGRKGHEIMFTNNGRAWKASEQARPMAAACDRAQLIPHITFHGLRHTYASLAVMNGVPLMVVAKNLGHTDTRMVEKHYGHLAETYVTEAIRKGAPTYGIVLDRKVTPLK